MQISAASTLLTHQVQGHYGRGGSPSVDSDSKKAHDVGTASKLATPLADDDKRGLLAEIQAMINAGQSHNNIKSYAEAAWESGDKPQPDPRRGFLFDGRL